MTQYRDTNIINTVFTEIWADFTETIPEPVENNIGCSEKILTNNNITLKQHKTLKITTKTSDFVENKKITTLVTWKTTTYVVKYTQNTEIMMVSLKTQQITPLLHGKQQHML